MLAKENVLGSKVTTSIAGVIALLSLLGFDADPATAEAIHQFIVQHGNSIANLIAVVVLLFANDGIVVKPKQDVEAEVRRVMALVLAEQRGER